MKATTQLNNFLRGKTNAAQQRLDHMCRKSLNLLWYPSAGHDYRDLLELSPVRMQQHGIELTPDLFIHTDRDIKAIQTTGILYSDERTVVSVVEAYELELIVPTPNGLLAQFDIPSETASPPIFLLDVGVKSDTLGDLRRTVLYAAMDNLTFLGTVVLQYRLPIHFFVKILEANGVKESVATAFAFLSVLDTRYVLSEKKIAFDCMTAEGFKTKHRLKPTDYTITKLATIDSWSTRQVGVFEISHNSTPITQQQILAHLETISQGEPVMVRDEDFVGLIRS